MGNSQTSWETTAELCQYTSSFADRSVRGCPFFSHRIVGFGFPVALHLSRKSWPVYRTTRSTRGSRFTHRGRPTKKNQRFCIEIHIASADNNVNRKRERSIGLSFKRAKFGVKLLRELQKNVTK